MRSVSQSMTRSSFWIDDQGNRPEVGTNITLQDVQSGKFVPANSKMLDIALRFLNFMTVEIWTERESYEANH